MKNLLDKASKFIFGLSIYLSLVINSELLSIINGESFGNIYKTIFPFRISTSILFFICLYISHKFINRNNSISLNIISLLFGVVMAISICYETVGTIFYNFSITILLILVLYIFGWYFLVSNLTSYLFRYFKKKLNNRFSFIDNLSNTKLFFISFFIIFICWLPYILTRYPAGMQFDAKRQVLQYFGYYELTNHHPIFSTMLIGTFVNFGYKFLSSYNIGIFLYVIFQSAISCGVLSYSLVFIRNYTKNNTITLFVLLCYSIVPIFPGYLTSVIKDALYSIFILFYIILMSDILFNTCSIRKVVCFIVSAFLVCLSRNNGIYVILFSLISVSIYYIANKTKTSKMLTLACFTTVLLSAIYSNVLLPALNIKNGSIAEALSIPFQQTARYLNTYYDELTKEELDTISSVLDVDVLLSEYNPLTSDPVKVTYHGDSESLKDYIIVWFKMFFKHPLVYIDATLNNSYGFLYADAYMKEHPNSGFYMNCDMDTMKTQLFSSYERLNKYKYIVYSLIELFETTPILYISCNIAIPSFVALYTFIYSIEMKKKELLLIAVPLVVSTLICIAAPTWINEFRYALPLVYSSLFILSLLSKQADTIH